MKKREIARQMARAAGVSEGEAADRLDAIVRDILAALRRGRGADLPGLGRFSSGPDGRVCFREERSERD